MHWIVWLLIAWIGLSLSLGILWLLGCFLFWLFQEHYEGNNDEDPPL